ncbi:FtsK/SpoIIIE domain-containing protein [Plantactinospora sp. CA-290183]|uniref:FtsK/SpoIIIE domain-containing protein n=1 Tax=Plantactinospora sp. CA-290183 TaxID=3240006 RepID=UPI003D8BB7BF
MADHIQPTDQGATVPGQRLSEYDAETHTIEAVQLGGPADPPDRSTTFAEVVERFPARPPIVPAWVRNRDQRVQVFVESVKLVGYLAGKHAWYSPMYAALLALWAPVGLLRGLGKAIWWARAEEGNWHLRQQAANANKPEEWRKLDHIRERQSSWRWWVLLAGLVVLAAAVVWALSPLAPWWARWVGLAIVVPVLARLGRPADKPILVRVTVGPKFVKLTAEMVRKAVVDLGVGVKELKQVTFPPPGIHRDGDGWLARFELPGAITAVKVLEKRDGLAASLRLPIDQVWPEVGPDHPGQVDLWVGYQPASKMPAPKWALASPAARTSFFEPNPFATDSRQRPINATLFETNYLLGGQPGSGKTYAARTLLTIGMLDPTCELKVAEFKGTGDFLDVERLCSTYVVGVDDEAFDQGRALIAWVLAECERRGKRILAARQRGEAPQGKITPELAKRKGSGLHPILVLIDEVHELFLARPETADMAERAIRRGRALGITMVLATQIPDSSSVPPNITRCVAIRWCLSVGGQVENDMILGTGAHKRGLTATVYRPKFDAGWGVLVGLEKSGAARSYFPDPETTAAIVARAAELRGTIVGDSGAVKAEARNLLADVRSVLRKGEAGMPWQLVAERLAELAPEFYVGYTADMVREAMVRYDIQSQDVPKPDDPRGRVKGVRRTALDAAQDRLEIEQE